jgi:hypothetical protein
MSKPASPKMAVPYHFYLIPIFSILTALSSIACLASKSTASHSYNAVTDGGRRSDSITLAIEFPNQSITLGTYPYYLGLNATTLVLVGSSIALVVSIALAALATRVVLQCKPVKVSLHIHISKMIEIYYGQLLWYHRQALFFALFANASLAFAAFITSSVLHGKSEHFSLFYVSEDYRLGYSGVYGGGVFDLETWTCEVKDLPSFQDVPGISQQCAAEMAGRICTAIMSIFAIGMFLAVWWDAKMHRAFIVVEWDGDRMAWDDEDDCELNDVAAMRQLGHIDLRKHRG